VAENSKIEWTTHTFNSWIGCQKVSPACDNCYAEAMMADRYGRVEWGPHGARSRTSPAYWRKPLAWNRAAEGAEERPRVFCASLADVFDNHRSILPEWRADLWALIHATPNLDWLLLTKRPQNIAKMLPESWGAGWPNVWLGVSTENQEEADRRIPILLETPAAVRFLSVEPLLGPVDLHDYLVRAQNGFCPMLDLVIVGGETGRGARPMHPSWARSLRRRCGTRPADCTMTRR